MKKEYTRFGEPKVTTAQKAMPVPKKSKKVPKFKFGHGPGTKGSPSSPGPATSTKSSHYDRERPNVANKFLPFIVEKSTPIHIYQTLLSRSKGMNTNLIMSVFYVVITHGITKVRKYVKTLADMTLETLYATIINHYQRPEISDSLLQLFLNLAPFMPSKREELWHEDLADFSMKEMLGFFLIMAKLGQIGEVTSMNFTHVYSQAHREAALANIQDYVEFTDVGSKYGFTDPGDLKAYILFHAYLSDEDTPKPCICAVLASGDSNGKT